eukprot:1777531-Amphidinium_carterae.1
MPAPSVKPKKTEEEQVKLEEATSPNDPPRSTPMLPLAELSSRPSSRAASRAFSSAPSVAPTVNYDTLWTSSQPDVLLSDSSIAVDVIPPSFGRLSDEQLLLLTTSSSGDDSSLVAKATQASLKSKRGRLEASTQQLRDHSE